MKSAFNLRFSILTVALLCVAAGASALTLGKARSVVLLGKHLDLTIPVGLGADEDVSTLCFDVDVFYGDVQLEASRVSVSVKPSVQTALATVRVTAQTAVDEPVVTVYFRAGCQHKVSRKYVLLTDVASEVEVPVQVRVPVVQPLVAVPAPVEKPRSPVALQNSAFAPSVAGRRNVEKPRKAEVSMPAVAKVVNNVSTSLASSKIAQKARLKLSPLDLRVERDPVLKSSDVLFDLPIEDLQKRAQAVATWRALNATPEEIMRQDAQLLSLDGNIKSLGELTVKNQDALMELAARLERAQAERYRNPLVYGLIVGLFVCLGGVAYLLLHMRRQNLSAGPWWRSSVMADRPAGLAREGVEESAPRSVAPQRTPTAKAPVGSHAAGDLLSDGAGVDIDLEVRESAFTRLVQDSKQDSNHSGAGILLPTTAVPPGHRDFSYSVNATLRAINTQEMLDERQQAEFFMTLGQHEDAIQLLEDSIHHSADANPLVYLDLLKMLHTLSRKAEFEKYREAFNSIFSGRIPPFVHFSEKGHGLDAYDDVCQHIAALWPTEDALHFIEQCLVWTQDGLTQEFDLDAFRDLLTLHGVLLRIFATSDTGLAPFSTLKAQALGQNGAASSARGPKDSFTPDQTMPLAVSVEGVASVDLDLSESSNLLEFEEIALSPPLPPTRP